METISVNTLYICGRCKRQLPPEAFYIDKKKQAPENYCKECRKEASRRQREAEKACRLSNLQSHSYPVITDIDDRELRMKLILKAVRFVRESVRRKRKRGNEELRMKN